jgi:hypothetical protein
MVESGLGLSVQAKAVVDEWRCSIQDMDISYVGIVGRDSEIGWSFWNSFTACDPVDVPH